MNTLEKFFNNKLLAIVMFIGLFMSPFIKYLIIQNNPVADTIVSIPILIALGFIYFIFFGLILTGYFLDSSLSYIISKICLKFNIELKNKIILNIILIIVINTIIYFFSPIDFSGYINEYTGINLSILWKIIGAYSYVVIIYFLK